MRAANIIREGRILRVAGILAHLWGPRDCASPARRGAAAGRREAPLSDTRLTGAGTAGPFGIIGP
jgi:hypothetical protein